MKDTYRHKGLRKKLVEEIEKKGIHDKKVLDSINRVPRHLFMDSGFVEFSYKDQAFPIGAGQTISQPFTVAFQTQLLEIQKNDKVLEIGTGSGYQAAILIELGAKVYTIERQRELYLNAQALLFDLGYKAQYFFGDGYEGQPSYGPFDKILITAGAPQVPEKLKEQLKIGGKMVVPVGDSNLQIMTLVDRTGENEFSITEHGGFIFVPMVKGKAI